MSNNNTTVIRTNGQERGACRYYAKPKPETQTNVSQPAQPQTSVSPTPDEPRQRCPILPKEQSGYVRAADGTATHNGMPVVPIN